MKTKDQKRDEALERQEVSDERTPKQRIKILNKGKFRAEKERKRLGIPEIPKGCVN